MSALLCCIERRLVAEHPSEPDYEVEPVISSASVQRQQQFHSASSSPISRPKRSYFFSFVCVSKFVNILFLHLSSSY